MQPLVKHPTKLHSTYWLRGMTRHSATTPSGDFCAG